MHEPIDDPAAWTAEQLVSHPEWRYVLSAAELAELEAATEAAARSGKALAALTLADFPLPSLSGQLPRWRDQLERGLGALLIHGLDPARYDFAAQRRLIWGLGLHLGTAVSQSEAGERIMSIENLAGAVEDHEVRGLNTSVDLDYHTDLADVVAMFSLSKAATGGQSSLVSAVAVHNHILATRPELLAQLYRPYRYASPGWDGAKAAIELRPIFTLHRGQLTSNYVRAFIDWAPEVAGAPALTGLEVEALDYLDEVCHDPRFAAWFILEPGQILLFNNFTAYHSRRTFVDDPETMRRRHLLRLWLAMPNSRELPESYTTSYGQIAAGAIRGGIHRN